MFNLPDAWTWDFWIADDGEQFHLFFLFAPRSLGDPELRHRNARVGHAVSSDLREWIQADDALAPSSAPACDDAATWTGSVIKDDDGLWWMFYTGASDDPIPHTQRVTAATSWDLMHWDKVGAPLVSADARWYETAATTIWGDETWRDPWVTRDADGLWHMLVTARTAEGEKFERGVIGHATSPDLLTWDVQPPLSRPGAGFGQAEVPQAVYIDGRWVVLFCCLSTDMAPRMRDAAGPGGTWAAPAEGEHGPFDLTQAVRVTGDDLYAGRAVMDRDGEWQFLAFRNIEDGEFVGGLSDPTPLREVLAGALLGN